MKDLISVIIPIYKVEELLPRCIDSIINQTYKNLEIILVDDGSPDNCGKICDEYAKKDARIKVIHKENGGLSDARNKGIDIATGKYIGFVDSDDYIHPNMYEILLKNLKDNKADMSVCMYKKVDDSSIDDVNIKNQKVSLYNELETFDNLYNNLYTATEVAWNKLYSKNVWNELRYPIGKCHEDAFVIHEVINKCNKVVYTNLELYYYYNRPNSIVNTFNLKRLDGIEAAQKRTLFFKEKNYQVLYEKSIVAYLKVIGLCYLAMYKNGNFTKELSELKEKFANEYKEKKKEVNISLKTKLQLLIMKDFPNLYLFIKEVVNKVRK